MNSRFIADCENEALHLSGAIQPHGALLLTSPDGIISHASENIDFFLQGSHDQWLDQPLPENLLRLIPGLTDEAGSRCTHFACIDAAAGPLDAVVTRTKDAAIIIELTHGQTGLSNRVLPSPLPPVPDDMDELTAARQSLVERVAELTGFHRVMFYLFREDGDGEVTAESRLGGVYGSYMHHRFPASDIPQVARALYLRNPWRMIPDASLEPISVRSRSASIVDLTWSDLRSVSPVHRMYLHNMQVTASLSFPVAVGDNLAAMIAAHHATPRELPLAILEQAAELVRGHALTYATYLAQRRIQLVDGLNRHLVDIRPLVAQIGTSAEDWHALSAWLLSEFAADGVHLCIDDEVRSAGAAFSVADLETLDAWFTDGDVEGIWSSENLGRDLPGLGAGELAGVLAVKGDLPGGGMVRLYIARKAHIHEVFWGGNPDKPVDNATGRDALAPRRSFEKWVERRIGFSRPWENESRLIGLKLRELLLATLQF